MFCVFEVLRPVGALEAPHARPHRREALLMHGVLKGICTQPLVEGSHDDSHRRETVLVFDMLPSVYTGMAPKESHAHTHG